MGPDNHIREEIVFGYRHGLLTPAELQEVDAHIASCSACREELRASMDIDEDSTAEAVQQMLAVEEKPARATYGRWYAIAAALVVAVGIGSWIAISHDNNSAPQTAFSTQTQDPQLTDLHRKADVALGSGKFVLPDFVSELQPIHEVLMGSASEARINLTAPTATAVATARPVFRWTALESGWTYRVRIFAAGFQLVAESPGVMGTEWTPATDLPSGGNLEWQVTAVRGDERRTFPQPPLSPPKFRVLDSAAVARLQQITVRPDASDLVKAAAYAEAGVLDDAKVFLKKAAAEQPARAEIQKLAESLNSK